MKAICEICNYRENCGYIKIGRTDKCGKASNFDFGYDTAVQKAFEWLKQFKGLMLPIDDEAFEQFKKAMEE